jgi:nucleoside-diphosphate-sugar epimerase
MRIDFSPLEGKRILITGHGGFIGSWMLQLLKESCVRCDVRLAHYHHDPKEFKELYAPIDYCVHLAPTDATIPLMAQARIKTLFTSSGAVYDKDPNEYGEMKVRTEYELVKSGLPLSIARIFSTYGPRMKPHFALSTFIRNGIEGKPLVLYGGGSSWRSYMYASDCAAWLWEILLRGDGVYDVGSRVGMTIRDLAHKIAHHFIPTPKIVLSHKEFIEPRPDYIPDTSRAAWELGLTHYMPFDVGIDRTIDWMRENK